MARVIDEARADALIHLAAIPSPPLGSPLDVFATNTQATFVALEAAGMAGIRRVAIASSTSVTGLPFASPPVSPLYVPIDEDHPNIGNDPYALSKEADEATAADDAAPPRLPGRRPPDLEHRADGRPAGQGGRGGSRPVRPRLRAVGLPRRSRRRTRLRGWRSSARSPGCHVVNVMAPDTYSPEPTAELLARYHPTTELRRPIVGREVPFDLTRSRELLGFEAEHLLPR